MPEETIQKLVNSNETITEDLQSIITQTQTFDWLHILEKVAIIITVIVIGQLIVKLVLSLLHKLFVKQHIQKSYQYVFITTVKGFLYFVIGLVVAGVIGLKTSSLIAIIGSIGFAIALGLKDDLSMLASGIFIIILQPIHRGDFIFLDDPEDGLLEVRDIRFFHTICTTGLNQQVVIPNSVLLTQKINNLSNDSWVRTNFQIRIPYGSDIAKAKEIILSTIQNHPDINQQKGGTAAVLELGEIGITLACSAPVRPVDFMRIKMELMESVYLAITKAGIGVAYRHMNITVQQSPEKIG